VWLVNQRRRIKVGVEKVLAWSALAGIGEGNRQYAMGGEVTDAAAQSDALSSWTIAPSRVIAHGFRRVLTSRVKVANVLPEKRPYLFEVALGDVPPA